MKERKKIKSKEDSERGGKILKRIARRKTHSIEQGEIVAILDGETQCSLDLQRRNVTHRSKYWMIKKKAKMITREKSKAPAVIFNTLAAFCTIS